MEDKFDVIIVGGGIAGAVTALLLAKEGIETVVVERGNYSGAKNMTGGRLYSHSLEKILPGFALKAPMERKITRERVSMMTGTSSFTVDYASDRLSRPGAESYTVLRSLFDRWLMEQAEEAGAVTVNGVLVEDLAIRDGKVCGIIAGGEEMFADVVVLADGANSQLMEKAGLQKQAVSPRQIAVGVKEIIELDEETINERFNAAPGEGTAWMFAGWPSDGRIGGGFLYTNRSSLSLGIVVTTAELIKSGKSVHEMLEQFRAHPAVRPLIEGGRLAEYSGHMVAEGGYSMVPSLHGNGIVAVGDAAHLIINSGYTVRGMDLAVGSAVAAAKAITEAKQIGNFSAAALGRYKQLLDDGFVMRDMKHYRKFPHFMENHRIFNSYPQMIDEMFGSISTVDGTPTEPMLPKLLKPAKKVGLLNIVKDGWKGVRSL